MKRRVLSLALLAMLVLSFPLLRFIDKKIKGRAGWLPRITAIETEGENDHGKLSVLQDHRGRNPFYQGL